MKKLPGVLHALCLLFVFQGFLLNAYSQNPTDRGIKIKEDTNTVKGSTYAIIIGISKYKNVAPLHYADKDAEAFQNFLTGDAGGKIPLNNIETFLNENATRPNIGDAISVLARKAKAGDRIYFFFAGHGDMEDLTQVENGLLLLYNSPNGNYFGMNDDVLEILNLKRYLSPLAERGIEMIFIVDACHAGNLKGGVQGVQQTAAAMAASWGKEYKILSCQPNQLSLESAEWGGGRGLFSLELEEGMKGLADMNNDGVINMFELQSYIQTNVAKYSEGKQIPLLSGDLTKPFVKINTAVLAALKKQKAESYPMLAVVNTKGNEEKYVDSLDAASKKIFQSFKKNIEDKRLIWPEDTNALRDYKLLAVKYPANPLITIMRRNLAASLNERFNSIVSPILQGKQSFSTRDMCYYAAAELDSCIQLLGEQHYMFTNLKARKLYMDAMALTWGLTETEYNISLKPTIEKAIELFEQSEALEPNAAYTLEALGSRYFYVYEYEKAFAKFQKYLDLRPNDFFAKYSLGQLYMKLKEYDKAQQLFDALIKEHPEFTELYILLSDAYFNTNKKEKSLNTLKKLADSLNDKGNYYFHKAIYFIKLNNSDSALQYYQLAKKEYKSYCWVCDNNIGYIYLLAKQMDSARYYFNSLIDSDSTYAFPHFNLGTIEAMDHNYDAAIDRFIKAIKYSPPIRSEAFITHMEVYFNKHYTITDSSLFTGFKNKVYDFNLQYASFLSILYCYLRDDRLAIESDKIEFIFSRLFNYKEFDVFSWYHHACYKAMQKDKESALSSIEKSLKLGFGNYFLLTSDDDLSFVRDSPEFKEILKKYFPDQARKN